ncbi:hypothetical protein ZWY2020_023549 [Hordeum vulgare]|nr:hypothetical protein ZWY2020_023549 [Hordeum vulgare]
MDWCYGRRDGEYFLTFLDLYLRKGEVNRGEEWREARPGKAPLLGKRKATGAGEWDGTNGHLADPQNGKVRRPPGENKEAAREWYPYLRCGAAGRRRTDDLSDAAGRADLPAGGRGPMPALTAAGGAGPAGGWR